MSVDEVLSRIEPYRCQLVEITGGEPLLQKEVYALIDRLLERGYKILIETSGNLSVKDLDKRVIKIMDLKCPASGEAEHNDYSNIEHLTAQDEIKFVIADRPDYLWAKKTMQRFSLPEKVTVLFSPVYQTLDPERLAAWILEDSLPVRMQLQMHKVIWGDRRGV
jgi:7-carboxy-7-deazaguanine synthase